MKRTLRRIASLLCALSLCLTLLPGMARAEDPSPLPEEPAAIECICQIPCTEDAVNPECPLCSLEGADLTLCLGVVPETPAEEPTEPEAPAGEPVDEIPAEEPTESEIPVEEPEEDVEDEPVNLLADEIPAEELVEEDVPSEADTVPEVLDMSISYNGSTIDRDLVSGSFVFTAGGDTEVADYTATIALSDDAVFTPTTPSDGDLYVEEVGVGTVTLKFNLTVGDVDISADQFALTLEETEGNVWTGGFEDAVGLSLETLAGYLVDQDIQLAAGALGAGSEARDILVNMDDEKVVLVLCDPDAVVYTVDYVVDDDTTITWRLPAGAEIPAIVPELTGGQEFAGWYTDSDRSISFTEGTTVTSNTTLYAKVNALSEAEAFLQALKAHQNVTIYTKTEWDTFVANSDVVVADQLITLGDDIDCDDTTYQSMTFAGNFNGNGKTISNATFSATSDTPSGESCSGMFATLGHGQIVANLTLDNIDVEYAGEYAGALAGMVDGWSNDRALVQNIQVRNSSVSGRSAGGVAGFIRNADVRYCSSRDTTITGLANGGGIVGLSNAKVEYCYSTTSPTALTFLGGCAGGVVGKNVRGAYTEYCWATMAVVGGSGTGTEAGGTDIGVFDNVSNSTTVRDFTLKGFTQDCWVRAAGTATDFNTSVVTYPFTVAN